MRIIVLGSTGYLGSRLVKQFVSEGHGVLCLKRPTSSLKRLDSVAGYVEFCNIDALENWLQTHDRYDCLVNAACKYPRNVSSDKDIFEANLSTPLHVFLDCISHNVSKSITIGTGLPDNFNAYARSKRALADIMRWYGERQNKLGEKISVCNVELENYYGENEPTDRFIPGTIEKLKRGNDVLLTSGEQLRDFIYVGDAVVGISKLVNSPELPEYVDIPLGTGEGVSIREVIEYLKDIIGSESRLLFGTVEKRIDEPDSIADCSKMREYGIETRYGWKDGLKLIL